MSRLTEFLERFNDVSEEVLKQHFLDYLESTIYEPKLIPLTDEYFSVRLEEFVKRYDWFSRKDNQFKFSGGDNSLLENALFTAYDAGVRDFRKYVEDNDVLSAERKLAETLNMRRARHHADELDFRRDIRQYIKDNA